MCSTVRVSGTSYDFAGKGSGHSAFCDDGNSVHEHVVHSLRELVRLLESSEVTNGCGIEDDDVGPHALFEDTAVNEAHALRGEGAELADRIFESKSMIFANVLSQDAREGSI